VVAVLRSQFNAVIATFLVVAGSSTVLAENLLSDATQTSTFIARIEAHTPAELSEILSRLDTILKSNETYPSSQPLALVLHGDEVEAFLSSNYEDNQALVDLAARLDAFNAVDIQVCETWMRRASATHSELPAFIETVPYGPATEKALLEQGFEYF